MEGKQFYYDFNKQQIAEGDFEITKDVPIVINSKTLYGYAYNGNAYSRAKIISSKTTKAVDLYFDDLNTFKLKSLNPNSEKISMLVDYHGNVRSFFVNDDNGIVSENKIDKIKLKNGHSIDVEFVLDRYSGSGYYGLKFKSAHNDQIVGYKNGAFGIKVPIKLKKDKVYTIRKQNEYNEETLILDGENEVFSIKKSK